MVVRCTFTSSSNTKHYTMKNNRITIKQSDNVLFVDVYLDGKFIGSVMANKNYNSQDYYAALKNNWHMDQMEAISDAAIDRLSTY